MAKKTNSELDESWQRFPEARIRMRDNGLKVLLDGLGPDGFCLGSPPRVVFDDNDEPYGVLVSISLNAGKHGSIEALDIDVFIPAKMPATPKKKAKKNEKLVPTVVADSAPELPDAPDEEAGSAPMVDSVLEPSGVDS